MSNSEYRLEMRNITKSFGGVHALKGVDFCLKPGEIHALMGENGAGKSTLMKILAGVYHKDSGQIIFEGKERNIKGPMDSTKLGVGVIYQEYALATHLSVAENIYIDNMSLGKKFINWKQLRKEAKDLLTRLNFSEIDVNEKVANLSVAYQQVVEICKSLSKDVSILVLDEPTALLSTKEVEKLFELLLNLKKQGVSIVYISHRLEEIFRICDRITVMKDGEYVGTKNTSELDQKSLANMMVGRSMEGFFPPRNATIGDVILEAKNLNCGRMVKNVSFNVRSGEILGFNGLVGAGRTETMQALVGLLKLESGEIYVDGKKVSIKNANQAFKNGIGYLSEDRKGSGVLLDLPIRYNITISALNDFSGKGIGWINGPKEIKYVNEMVADLAIKIGSIKDDTSSLSGGNQQKVSIGKVLATKSRVLIFDEPTRGVDIGSKQEIYRIMNQLAEQGDAIIMISSEMEEIMGMCDRVVVMHEGHVTGELEKKDMTEHNLIQLAMEVEQ